VRALVGLAAILLVMAVLHGSQAALIVCVVVSGTFLGVTNTLMTQVVMQPAHVPRPIASSSYSFVRFCGGAIAPFVAGKLGEDVSVQAPFYLGAAMTAISVGLLAFYRRSLGPVEPAERAQIEHAGMGAPADQTGAAEPDGVGAAARPRPITH
jgi:predicted MFS family arabinose efflux permease